MVRYDENVLQAHADALYQQAAFIAWLGAVVGGLVLFLPGAFGALIRGYMGFMGGGGSGGLWFLAILAGAVGAGVGWVIGTALGDGLRLAAQATLCIKQIECNTRRAAE